MSINNTRVVKQWIPQAHDLKKRSSENIYVMDIDGNPNHRNVQTSGLSKEEIIEEAMKEAAEIKKKAYQEGFDSGILDAKKKLDEICTKQKENVDQVMNEIDELKEQMNNELEDKVLSLSVTIAEKIVNMKLESDDSVFVGIVKNTIAMMDSDDKLTLKLNHREYEKYFGISCNSLLEELQCGVPVAVVQDKSINEGGLILESEKGFVNAGIDTQLSRLANSITQRDKQYHEAL